MKCQRQIDSLTKQFRIQETYPCTKQRPKKTPTNVKITMKTGKTVKLIDNKGNKTKENNRFPERNNDA